MLIGEKGGTEKEMFLKEVKKTIIEKDCIFILLPFLKNPQHERKNSITNFSYENIELDTFRTTRIFWII